MELAPLLVCGALALASACHATSSDVIAPEGVSSVWEHLSLEYDRDADGAIAPEEYGRESADFARLDADADGLLTPADFPDERYARDLGIRDMPTEQRALYGARYAARAVVLAYFQPDEGATELTRDALERGFDRLDGDASGVLDEAEFARATQAMPWCGPGDAWELLLAAADAPAAPQDEESSEPPPADGRIAREELVQYHAGMSGKEGVLRGPPGADPRDARRGIASDGPPVGSPAPDFELAPPQGGRRVRLSSWQGAKPVALVFGSYT